MAYNEEEDYTWTKQDPVHKNAFKKNRTALGLFLLVGECFIPAGAARQFRKLFKPEKEKHVRYS